jgi:mercuric ion transport protein
MISIKSNNTFLSAGIFSAIAASLCCITPVLALIAGSSSLASTFSWIEPLRPYLIGVTFAVLGFAWYQKLKPRPIDDCNCTVNEKLYFTQSKGFLVLITIFAALMITFPYYSQAFFPNNKKQVVVINKSNKQTAEFKINGMNCTGCEGEVKHEVNKLDGIISTDVSYKNASAKIQFDNSKTTISEIKKAINSTGYKVIYPL